MSKENSGIDVATNMLQNVGEIADRYGFVIRYYSHNPDKNLTEPELQALLKAGLKVGIVWETNGNHATYFTAAQGQADARDALAMADALGQYKGSAIYFAVDCDTVPGTTAHGVTAYFAAIHAAFTAKEMPYLVGVYGSGTVCQALKADGLAHYTWLAQSTGWSGYHSYKDYDMLQGPSQHGYKTSFDSNTLADGRTAGLFSNS